jgi:tetratricopeptide (TPR) repeat protein
VLAVTERQLKSWEAQGLVEAAEMYGFQELVALRTLGRLRQARIPPAKIKRALNTLREKLSDVTDPLTQLRIYSDGPRIRVQIDGQRMESDSGQLLLDFGEKELLRLVALPSRREQERAANMRRQREEAENWFQRGVELEQSGTPIDQAIDAYKLAIAQDPAMAAAMVNLGTIYFTMRDFDRASKYYLRALEANPKYPLAHFNMGNLCDEKGDRIKALFHYQTAIKLDPLYADAHYNLALLYQSSGQVMKAVRYWRTYLKLDTSSQWAEIARRELEKLYEVTLVKGAAGSGSQN